MEDFSRVKTCSAVTIMRELNAGKVIFLVVKDKDKGRLRIESYLFEPSARMKSGKALAAWWAYSKDSVPDDDTFTAGMCYAKDLGTWLSLAEKYGRHCVPGIEMTYKEHFAWYLTGVHFFDDSKTINAEYELFTSERTEGFCRGIEQEFANYYFGKYIN